MKWLWCQRRNLWMGPMAWIPIYKDQSNYWCLRISNLPAAETNPEIWYGTIPHGDQYPLGCHWALQSWKGQQFLLTGIDTYSRSGFSFSAWRASVSITIQEFIPCLTHGHGIPYYIASDQEPHIAVKEVQDWVLDHRVLLDGDPSPS